MKSTKWREAVRGTARVLIALALGLGVATPVPGGERNGPALWRVAGPHGSLHVMGSIHVLAPSDVWMDAPIDAAFTDSACLALEIDLATIQPDEIATGLRAAGRYAPDAPGLQANLSEKTYRRFLGMADDLAISPESLDRFRPWLVALTLSTRIVHALGFEDEFGVDYVFLNRAQATGMPVVGLESLADQVAALSDSDGRTDEQVMKEALEALERAPRLVKRLASAWRHGDMQTVDRIVTREFADHPSDYQRLIGQRNRAWAARLEDMLETGQRCMVVVGAGHLVGDASLLALLADAGYAVTRE